MNDKPLVSVLMTVYNREHFIGEAIDSVLASSYTNFELIVVDDCSKDNSVFVARSYEAKDPRIKVYTNGKNLGDYNNRNKAASYATGKYLKYIDSDDTIYPWGLEAMVWCMENEPSAGYGLMSHNLDIPKAYPVMLSGEEAYRAFFFKGGLIAMGPIGAIFKREAFEKAGGFSGKPYVGDSEMWLKMSRYFPVVQMPLELVWWRQHEGQQIREGNKNNYYIINQFKVYKESLAHPDCPLREDERSMALRNMQNLRARHIIFHELGKLRWKQGLSLLKASNMNLFDLVKGLSKNRYPA